jgi:hypothetical protein
MKPERRPLTAGSESGSEIQDEMTEDAKIGGERVAAVDHPTHYGGVDNPYEAIKVVEAWDLGFHLGNVVKYVSRAGKKGDALEDLKKARWYLDRHIANLEAQAKGGVE